MNAKRNDHPAARVQLHRRATGLSKRRDWGAVGVVAFLVAAVFVKILGWIMGW